MQLWARALEHQIDQVLRFRLLGGILVLKALGVGVETSIRVRRLSGMRGSDEFWMR